MALLNMNTVATQPSAQPVTKGPNIASQIQNPKAPTQVSARIIHTFSFCAQHPTKKLEAFCNLDK